jgi:immune inhibitor A
MKPVVLLAIILALLSSCSSDAPGATPSPRPTPSASPQPASPIPDGPSRNLFDLARRYRGVSAQPLDNTALFPDEQAGAIATFKVLVGAGPEFREIQAELVLLGEHAAWYIESGVGVNTSAVRSASKTFDDSIYPYVVEVFGNGLEPGGRITILNADLTLVAGYFGGADQVPTSVDPLSNERVMLYMNTNQRIGSASYFGTLTHELQHLIHHIADPNEATWVNEGLSEYAARAGGYPALPVAAYFRNPDRSSTRWPEDIEETLPSYAGASLLVEYLAARTGGLESIGALVAAQADDVEGVQEFLSDSGLALSFEDIFADWVVANYVNADQGPYAYTYSTGSIQPERSVRGTTTLARELPQFGAWYLFLDPGRPLEVRFQGTSFTPLLPVPPASGSSCWWSNRNDNMDATLTRSVDLTPAGATGAAVTLRFKAWYSIEKGYDFSYIAVSQDQGITWTALEGRHTTSDDPGMRALGPGYTGRSDGWVQEEIDLSSYAGSDIMLRFEYVTDDSFSSDGWCVDDVEIPEMGFFDDAETDSGWTAEGFVLLPTMGVSQQFIVQLVTGTGDEPQVKRIALDSHNDATFTVEEPAMLIIASMAPKTRQPALFSVETAVGILVRPSSSWLDRDSCADGSVSLPSLAA